MRACLPILFSQEASKAQGVRPLLSCLILVAAGPKGLCQFRDAIVQAPGHILVSRHA